MRLTVPYGAAIILSAVFPDALQAQSLEETVAAAVERSPTIAAAAAREDSAAAAVAQAHAERNPTATAQGQIGVGRIDPGGFFGLPADSVTPRVAEVSAQWPLFTGGRVGAAIAQADAGREIAALSTHGARLDVRLQVVRAYTQALAGQEQERSYAALETALAEVLRQSRLMFSTGAATSTDVAQAEARLAEAQAGLAQAKGALAEANARLTRLAGAPVAIQTPLPEAPPLPQNAQLAADQAIATNPQVQQARKAATFAEASVRMAQAERRPTVAAYAQASSIRDQFFPGYKADAASVGVRAQWNFFTGGRTSAKISKAEADARAASFDAAAAEDRVAIQAIQGFEAVRAARAMLTANEKRATATQEALRSTRLEVKTGIKPQLALLDAEREAIAAQSALIEATGNLLTAAYTLRSITGMD